MKKMSLSDRLTRISMGLIDVASGLVATLTLGQYCPSWSFDYACYRVKKQAKKASELT